MAAAEGENESPFASRVLDVDTKPTENPISGLEDIKLVTLREAIETAQKGYGEQGISAARLVLPLRNWQRNVKCLTAPNDGLGEH